MKRKFVIVLAALAVTFASFAGGTGGGCGTSQCPGGSQHCCTDAAGNSFYNHDCGCN